MKTMGVSQKQRTKKAEREVQERKHAESFLSCKSHRDSGEKNLCRTCGERSRIRRKKSITRD